MVDEKKDPPPKTGADIVQRYRFRVRTADGRELISHVATVTRPAPPVAVTPEPVQQAPVEKPLEELKTAPVEDEKVIAAEEEIAPEAPPEEKPEEPPEKPQVARVDVPVHRILVSLTGAKQGPIKTDPGFTDAKGEADIHSFDIEQFTYAVRTPRDPASGMPTGQRMHEPVVFVKANSPSTPLLYQALTTNETLPVVIFDCYGTDKAGKVVLAHTVKLTNANVASMDFNMPNLRDPALVKFSSTETIALTYQKVELLGPGGKMATDDWASS